MEGVCAKWFSRKKNKKLQKVIKKISWNSKKKKKKKKLDPDVVTCDEQDIISALQVAFEREIILTQHCLKNKRIDAYFSKYKLGIEVDEYNHEGRNLNTNKVDNLW